MWNRWVGRLPVAHRRLCWAAAGACCAFCLHAWLLTRGFFFPLWALALCGLVAAGLLVCPGLRRTVPCLCLAFFGLGTLWFGLWRLWRVEPQLALAGRSGRLLCRTTQYAQGKDGYGLVEVRAQQLDGENVEFTAVLYLEDASPHFEPGQLLSVQVLLERAPLAADRGYSRQGIFLRARQIGPLEQVAGKSPVSAWPALAARRIVEICRQRLPGREGALLAGMLTGQKDALTASQRRELNLSGTAHLVAVSGLHISVLLAMCFALLGRRWGGLLGLPLAMGMTLLAGCTPSALRALVMAACGMAAFWLRRDQDAPDALAAALLLILLFRPMSGLDIGLQLSFSATAGLVWVAPALKDSIFRAFPGYRPGRQLLRRLLGGLAVSFSAQVFSLPFASLAFQRLSLVGLAANLLLLPLVAPVLALGLLMVLLDRVWPAACPWVVWLLRLPLSWMDWVQRKAAALPFASVSGSVFLLVFAWGCGLAMVFWLARKKVRRGLAIGALLAVLCLGGGWLEQLFAVKLTIANSRGSGLLLVSQSGQVTAFCSGKLRVDAFYTAAQQALDRLGGGQIGQLWLTQGEGIGSTRPAESHWARVERQAGPEGLLPALALGEQTQVYRDGGSFSFPGGQGTLVGQNGQYAVQLRVPGCVVLAACGQQPAQLLKLVQQFQLTCDILVVDSAYAQDLPRLAAICRRAGPDLLVCVQPSFRQAERSVGAAFAGPVAYLPADASLEMTCWAPPGRGKG